MMMKMKMKVIKMKMRRRMRDDNDEDAHDDVMSMMMTTATRIGSAAEAAAQDCEQNTDIRFT